MTNRWSQIVANREVCSLTWNTWPPRTMRRCWECSVAGEPFSLDCSTGRRPPPSRWSEPVENVGEGGERTGSRVSNGVEEWARGNGLEFRRPMPVAFDGPPHCGLRLHGREDARSCYSDIECSTWKSETTPADALLHSSVVLPVWLILILRLFLFMYYVCPK